MLKSQSGGQRLYRVVESFWGAQGRFEKEIGCEWKSESKAKEELRQMKRKFPSRSLSLQRRG